MNRMDILFFKIFVDDVAMSRDHVLMPRMDDRILKPGSTSAFFNTRADARAYRAIDPTGLIEACVD